MIQCDCGKVFTNVPVFPLRCLCGRVFGEKDSKQSAWVRWVKLLRKPEDAGIGDTVARIAARFGGERFKAFSKRIGIPCGCTERQKSWNELYPY